MMRARSLRGGAMTILVSDGLLDDGFLREGGNGCAGKRDTGKQHGHQNAQSSLRHFRHSARQEECARRQYRLVLIHKP